LSMQVNFAWTGSMENAGVTAYRAEWYQGARCSNLVHFSTTVGTTFNGAGPTASTSYNYRVRPTDAAENVSTFSSKAKCTTHAGADTPIHLRRPHRRIWPICMLRSFWNARPGTAHLASPVTFVQAAMLAISIYSKCRLVR